MLLNSHQSVYLSVPTDTVAIPHIFVKKLQLCNWLVVKPINKTPSTISIVCWTKISNVDRKILEIELELVNIDEALGQAVQHHNDIGCNLTKS